MKCETPPCSQVSPWCSSVPHSTSPQYCGPWSSHLQEYRSWYDSSDCHTISHLPLLTQAACASPRFLYAFVPGTAAARHLPSCTPQLGAEARVCATLFSSSTPNTLAIGVGIGVLSSSLCADRPRSSSAGARASSSGAESAAAKANSWCSGASTTPRAHRVHPSIHWPHVDPVGDALFTASRGAPSADPCAVIMRHKQRTRSPTPRFMTHRGAEV